MSNEQLYYDTLRVIAKDFMPAEQVLRRAEKEWGLPPNEALEMSYDNMQQRATQAIKGKRRPRT